MKTYTFTILQKNNSRDGNPRSRITVFRIKRNTPHLLGEPNQLIGYKDNIQAAGDIILKNEPGWSAKIWNYASGAYHTSVERARYNGKIRIIHL